MKKCIDTRLGNMLHAYELGMISDEDRAQFEMHLMECDYCYEQARLLAAEADQLRDRPEMSEAIRETVEQQSGSKPSRRAERKRWPRLIPALAVAAVVIIVLILQPGKLEIQYSDEAIAHENRLAIMYLDNLADPQDSRRLGEIVTNLLIADLSESQYMRVVSSQRMQDILKANGYQERRAIADDAATQVAKKARARWILTGNILQTEPSFAISTQLADVATGDIVASQTISGEIGEDIFAVIDDLTQKIKNELGLPSRAYSEPDPAIADITTHSEAAYRLFLVGLDYKNKFYYEDAQKCFKDALVIDSTMAMAYYYLTWLESGPELAKAMERAIAYSDQTGWKDRQFIISRRAYLEGDYWESVAELRRVLKRYPDEKDAYFAIGECFRHGLGLYDSTIVYMKHAIDLDSLFGLAYNTLAYTYNDMGELEKAIEAVDLYIAAAPGEANPYDSKSDILTKNGRIAEAIEAAEKAVEIKPDLYFAIKYLGILYVYNKQYDKAAECFRTLASGNDAKYRLQGRQFLPLVPLYQGKFNEALQVLDDAFAADRIEQSQQVEATILKMSLQLIIYYQQGDYETGLAHSRRTMELYHQAVPNALIYLRDGYIYFLVATGNFDQAKSIAEEIRTDVETKAPASMDHYWYVMGIIAFAEKEYNTALDYLSRAYETGKNTSGIRLPPTIYWLARANQEVGQAENAAALYESLLSMYDEYRLFWATISVLSHYQLGRVYEAMGRTDDAVKQYREFVDIWENADNGRTFIEDALKRLSNLGG